MKKYNITVNGNTYEVIVEEVGAVTNAPLYTPAPAVAPVAAPIPTPVATPAAPAEPVAKAPAAPASAGSVKVTSPMPGTILDVKVTVGQAVKKGDVV